MDVFEVRGDVSDGVETLGVQADKDLEASMVTQAETGEVRDVHGQRLAHQGESARMIRTCTLKQRLGQTTKHKRGELEYALQGLGQNRFQLRPRLCLHQSRRKRLD